MASLAARTQHTVTKMPENLNHFAMGMYADGDARNDTQSDEVDRYILHTLPRFMRAD